MVDLMNTDWLGKGMGWINDYTAKLTAMDMGSVLGLLAVLMGISAIIFAFTQIGKEGQP